MFANCPPCGWQPDNTLVNLNVCKVIWANEQLSTALHHARFAMFKLICNTIHKSFIYDYDKEWNSKLFNCNFPWEGKQASSVAEIYGVLPVNTLALSVSGTWHPPALLVNTDCFIRGIGSSFYSFWDLWERKGKCCSYWVREEDT